MKYDRVEGILAHCNCVIGKGDKIPWHSRDDLMRFKQITQGHALLMGAKTFLGIAKNYFVPGKNVLPGRDLIIYGESRDQKRLFTSIIDQLEAMNRQCDASKLCTLDSDQELESVFSKLAGDQKIFIAGGASVYDKFIENCSTVHSTNIEFDTSYFDWPDYAREKNIFEDKDAKKVEGYVYLGEKTFCNMVARKSEAVGSVKEGDMNVTYWTLK